MVCAFVRRDNPRALARGLSTGQAHKPCSITHLLALNTKTKLLLIKKCISQTFSAVTFSAVTVASSAILSAILYLVTFR